MGPLFKKLEVSPLWVRVAPFAVFVALTFCQGKFGEASRYWIYLAKTIVGAWLIWMVRPLITEMRWKFSWEAVAVGVAVFVMWVGMDRLYPNLDRLLSYIGLAKPKSGAELASEWWNPHAQFGQATALAWIFSAVRIVGSSIVVPSLEEVFYRSFLCRYIAKADFQSVPLGQFSWAPFLITSAVFGLAHNEWLAGILCGFAYQGLVCWKQRLGDAMTAHAITNFLLGLWVILRGAWNFW
jgi:CAAX protease family protein